jgi:NADH-quinone oxidoreductase subunit J
LAGIVFLGLIVVTLVGAGIATLTERLIHSVAGLALCFIGVAGLYYYLNSPFIALMQILIYIGAVCVTIVFAVMLAEPQLSNRISKRNPLSGPVAFIAAGVMTWGLAALAFSVKWPAPLRRVNDGSLPFVGKSLLTTYSMSFELISVILLVAIIGALVLARAGRSR